MTADLLNFGGEVSQESERLFPGWETLADLITASGLGKVEIAILSGKIAAGVGLNKSSLEPIVPFLSAYAALWAVIGARARERWMSLDAVSKPN